MRQIDYDEGKELIISHVCGECQAPLTLAWGGAFGFAGHVIRCGVDPSHAGEIKHPKPTIVPIYIQDNIDRKEKREMVEKHGEQVGAVVAKYHGVTSLTERDAALIVQSFWPDAPPLEVKKAAITCATYGLNPCMRHLYLIPYKDHRSGVTTWRQVLGIGATRLMASRRAPYGVTDGPRVMTEDEQLSIRGVFEKDKWWALCTVVDKHGLSATGYGGYPKQDNNLKGRDKGNSEQNMAFIRAERNALDKKFPGEMPADIEVVDEAYEEQPPKGEVIQGEATVLEEELFPPTGTSDQEDNPNVKRVEETPPPSPKLLTKAHAAEIGALKSKLTLTDAEYSHGLNLKFGKTKTEDLTDDEAKELIAGMMAKLEKNSEK